MLRLSRMNDYAVVVLGQLASQPERPRSASELAEATGLAASTVSQVLKALAHAGLAASVRGAHGGYTADRPPGDISVAEIVLAVDGPVALTACVDGGDCAIEATCLLRGSWDRINNAVRGALEAVTLADMLAPMQDFSRFEPKDFEPQELRP
ncbi:MAG: SUF system Fe-S cluster assembly regulator [Alphaproteobacteria bacterium]|nr:SUF system Fe-S cluster assembly regulator [Alphaproteobacteria bacterium]MCY4231063.1 SUF system Fe-S cluster assembly regulator [Alphaproteobacteria bacterium]MCY4319696.1 SUF system Fe-S cluster assembly regulator [Alphaproteobacteria bacterium]